MTRGGKPPKGCGTLKNNVKQKQVASYPGDRDLLEWAESRDEPFATYVKRLVREGMEQTRKGH